jgi:hypothetical protein
MKLDSQIPRHTTDKPRGSHPNGWQVATEHGEAVRAVA